MPVFSRKLIITDPAILDAFITEDEEEGRRARKRDFTYSGACAAAESKDGVELLYDDAGTAVAIVVATPRRGREFPIFKLVKKKGRVARIVIVFDGDPCGEKPKTKRRSKGSF